MTPSKRIIPHLIGLTRAHLVIRFRFSSSLNFSDFLCDNFAILMQILKWPAKLEMMTKK